MVYTYYMVCVTCVLIEQLVPARPSKSLKGHRETSPNGDGLPLVVLRGCFAAKRREKKLVENIYNILNLHSKQWEIIID